MGTRATGGQLDGAWRVLAHHDWEGITGLETTLAGALRGLAGAENPVLYDYIDVEAIADAINPAVDGRGASEVRFKCEGYTVRITRDGTIAAR
jgi:hypothetical protein